MKRVLAAVVILGLAGLHADQCPGSQQKCGSGMTCCELPSGQQGCCPYANATCCFDKVHCCPMGSTCSTKGGGHCQNTHEFEIVQHAKSKHSADSQLTNASQILAIVKEVCGDGSQCPDRSTCCPLNQTEFGCCPMPSAVCCSDKRHCCPEGTKCDETGYCHKTNFVESIRAQKVKAVKKAIGRECPGGTGAQCPDSATCCSVGPGQWGCCPTANAVCCPDEQTCCPQGYQCSSSQGQPGCHKQD